MSAVNVRISSATYRSLIILLFHLHMWRWSEYLLFYAGSRCGRADSVMDSHTTGPGFKTRLLPTVDHRDSIKLSVRWFAWKVGEGFPGRVSPKTLKWVAVFQCYVPHQWIAQRQVGPVSVYCDGVGCRVLCLGHGIPVCQHIGQSTTATSRHRRDMTSDVSKRR